MSAARIPAVIPVGWQRVSFPGGRAIVTERGGLKAIFSIEDTDGHAGPGTYPHISISRPDRYPDWDELRAFVYGCGLFDRRRDVVMILPPPAEYVNVHPNCFHFYQVER